MKKFALRLTQIMREKGYGSERSQTGIDTNQLAKISGCSYQMARKYALGQAFPEIPVLLQISEALEISPDALLIDRDPFMSSVSGSLINIEPEILKYILSKSASLFSLSNKIDSIVTFIIGIVYDAAHLQVDTPTLYKIVDRMIASITALNTDVQDDKIYATMRFE